MSMNARFPKPHYRQAPPPPTPSQRQEGFTRGQVWSHRPQAPGLWDGPVPGDKCETWSRGFTGAAGAVLIYTLNVVHPLMIKSLAWWGTSFVPWPAASYLDINLNGTRFHRLNGAGDGSSPYEILLVVNPGTITFVCNAVGIIPSMIVCTCWQSTQGNFESPENKPPGR